MTAVQAHQSHENFELRRREPFSNTPAHHDHHGEGERETQQLPTTQLTLPSRYHPTEETNSSPATFRILIATNTGIGNIVLSTIDTSASASTSTSTPKPKPVFYVANDSLRRNTPSVTLSHGTKDGPILGTLKLGFSRDNTFGIGDPLKETAGGIAWENLRRTSEWTHGTYEFAYRSGDGVGDGDRLGKGNGKGNGNGNGNGRRVGGEDGDGNRDGDGERRVYVWQRTKQSIFSDQPNMELREKLMSGGMGEVLAVYKGNQGMMWKSRGQFSILQGLDRGKPGWSGKEGGEWSEFELAILLTGLGIIEGSRRRARGRRGAGASGGGG